MDTGREIETCHYQMCWKRILLGISVHKAVSDRYFADQTIAASWWEDYYPDDPEWDSPSAIDEDA